jgi:hypothetical protein
MGRPLKKSLFGANAKNNLKVQFYNGTASKQGYIVKQVGSRRFKCKDAAGNAAICKLVNKAAGSLAAGEMTITVKLDSGTVANVQKISSKMLTVYAANGGSPGRYPWNFSTSTSDGYVQVEEAGTSTSVISTATGATNLAGDVET